MKKLIFFATYLTPRGIPFPAQTNFLLKTDAKPPRLCRPPKKIARFKIEKPDF
jgi:hypothetical protein